MTEYSIMEGLKAITRFDIVEANHQFNGVTAGLLEKAGTAGKSFNDANVKFCDQVLEHATPAIVTKFFGCDAIRHVVSRRQ